MRLPSMLVVPSVVIAPVTCVWVATLSMQAQRWVATLVSTEATAGDVDMTRVDRLRRDRPAMTSLVGLRDQLMELANQELPTRSWKRCRARPDRHSEGRDDPRRHPDIAALSFEERPATGSIATPASTQSAPA